MALVAINQPRQKQIQPSKIERVLQGLGLAASITGDVVGTVQGVKTNQAQREKLASDIERGEEMDKIQRDDLKVTIGSKFKPATQEEIDKGEAFTLESDVSPFGDKPVVARDQGGGLLDTLIQQTKLEKLQTDIETTKAENERKSQELQLTPLEKRIDEKFANTYEEYVLNGGFAVAQKNIETTRSALKALRGEGNISGPWIGMAPPELKSLFASESVDTQEKIESAILSSLRATLGAQFTEKEGERVLSKTFNPRLEESVNYERGMRLLNELEGINKAKRDAIKHYEENKTMSGYKFKMYETADELLGDVDFEGLEGDTGTTKDITEKDIDNMSIEELRKAGLLD